MKKGFLYRIPLYTCIILLSASCSVTKFVPEGSYLLDEVKIQTDNKEIKQAVLKPYVRQSPNSKWFGLIKTQLYLYNLSGRDSTRWHNKFFRKIGDAPVIYNESDAQRLKEEVTKTMYNLGYMSASVECTKKIKKKKIKLFYRVTTGQPYIVRSLTYNINDEKIAGYIAGDSIGLLLKEGMIFDVNLLDAERQRIAKLLLNNGYYKFHKDLITYTADTVRNSFSVDLTLHLHLNKEQKESSPTPHRQYTINKVSFIADYNMLQTSDYNFAETGDSVRYKDYSFYYKDKLYLRPKVLADNFWIRPGTLYNEREVDRTYTYLGRLPALKYTNIRFLETDSTGLDCYVMLTKSKFQTITAELEGTNSVGDLGAAASVSFQHRNFFRGSETFLLKFRGAYEAISGLQQGYKSDNYTEYGVETSITFPDFLFPFLSSDLERRIRATTEFGMQYNYQLRPEFSRTVAAASWSYKWMYRRRAQHRIDLLDVSYLYMPWKSEKFVEDYLQDEKNYVMAYNYKDRLIVRTGYMYNYSSIGSSLMKNNTIASNSHSIRVNIESAGNVLFALCDLAGVSKNDAGEYSVLNIPFAQYVKGDFDFAKNVILDPRNSLAFHLAAGIAVPYGNAKVLPLEKQYFSGGANSVRGWSMRTLGPGSYQGDSGKYLDQFGEIKLDASVEYRSKLFWKFQGAMFVDAGNVWTTRDYETQPGGAFKLNRFYKQIAVAYGLGLRLDFDFFILRLDGGMKALNPMYDSGKNRYPIVRPDFGRDFAFHFAVGYPF